MNEHLELEIANTPPTGTHLSRWHDAVERPGTERLAFDCLNLKLLHAESIELSGNKKYDQVQMSLHLKNLR